MAGERRRGRGRNSHTVAPRFPDPAAPARNEPPSAARMGAAQTFAPANAIRRPCPPANDKDRARDIGDSKKAHWRKPTLLPPATLARTHTPAHTRTHTHTHIPPSSRSFLVRARAGSSVLAVARAFATAPSTDCVRATQNTSNRALARRARRTHRFSVATVDVAIEVTRICEAKEVTRIRDARGARTGSPS